MRVAEAASFELVIGLRRADARTPHTVVLLHAQGFDLVGTLQPNAEDGLADFVALREPSPFEGPS
jgi:hypothetical protein